MSLDNEMDQMVRGNEKATLRAEVARLTAELAAAKQERDALALTAADANSRAMRSTEEKAALAVALGKIAEDLSYENDPVHIDPAAILATVRAKARAEGMREAARYFRDNDYAEESKITELEDLADAEEVGSAPKT